MKIVFLVSTILISIQWAMAESGVSLQIAETKMQNTLAEKNRDNIYVSIKKSDEHKELTVSQNTCLVSLQGFFARNKQSLRQLDIGSIDINIQASDKRNSGVELAPVFLIEGKDTLRGNWHLDGLDEKSHNYDSKADWQILAQREELLKTITFLLTGSGKKQLFVYDHKQKEYSPTVDLKTDKNPNDILNDRSAQETAEYNADYKIFSRKEVFTNNPIIGDGYNSGDSSHKAVLFHHVQRRGKIKTRLQINYQIGNDDGPQCTPSTNLIADSINRYKQDSGQKITLPPTKR